MRRLWDFYRHGITVEVLQKRFPQLEPAQVLDALAFALDNPEVMEADLARESEVLRRLGQRPPPSPTGPEQIELPFDAPRAVARKRRRTSPKSAGRP